jgi:hypothetical protein
VEKRFLGISEKTCDCVCKALNPEEIRKDIYKLMITNQANDVFKLIERIDVFTESFHLPKIFSLP